MTRTTLRTVVRAAAAGMVLLAVLAGCGGDEQSPGSAAAGGTTPETGQESGPETGPETGPDAGPETDEPTEPDGEPAPSALPAGGYCGALKAATAQFDALSDQAGENLDEAFAIFERVARRAPDEIAAEWDTVVRGYARLRQAVEDGGYTLDDLAVLQQDPDADARTLQRIGRALHALSADSFQEAGQAIDEHADKACGIDLEDDGPE